MNNLLIISCKWYINTFKNLPIIVKFKQYSKKQGPVAFYKKSNFLRATLYKKVVHRL